MFRQIFRRGFWRLLLLLAAGAANWVQAAGNALEQVNAAASGDQVTVRLTFRDPVGTTPPGFSTSNPARVALDLAGASSALEKSSQAVNQGFLRSVSLAQTEERLRVVLNLDRAATYQLRADGRDLFVTLVAVGAGEGAVAERPAPFAPAPPPTVKSSLIRDIAFRRGPEGEAKVIVDLSDPDVGVDVRKQGQSLVVEFSGADIPDTLAKRMDVNDFATAVSTVTTSRQGDKVRMVVVPRGNWDHVAYQSESQFVLEVRAVADDPSKLGGGVRKYQGEKLSLRFRDYPVKEVLQAFSDFSGLNVVVSEAVSGTINLNLQDVPWDQALDIVLEQKNLALRKNGNVLMIAPRDEVLARAKVATEAAAFEPAVDAIFQVNYLKATEAKSRVVEFLNFDPQKTTNVKVMADTTSNKLFVKAPETALEEVRRILREIDLPPRQVLIEARIVEADNVFTRDLGTRLSFFHDNRRPDAAIIGRGNNVLTARQLQAQTALNLPAPENLSFLLTNGRNTRILELELAALESDARGRVISSPRVLATNGGTATIEDGVEIPFAVASSSGATAIQFKKATLSLDVKPTITADGKISMDVKINKDTQGVDTIAGPAINTKNVSTKVVVENGGTMVIGGLYTETKRDDEPEKIPFFGDLPYVGWLFKVQSKVRDKRELLVFITPRIVTDQLTLQ